MQLLKAFRASAVFDLDQLVAPRALDQGLHSLHRFYEFNSIAEWVPEFETLEARMVKSGYHTVAPFGSDQIDERIQFFDGMQRSGLNLIVPRLVYFQPNGVHPSS